MNKLNIDFTDENGNIIFNTQEIQESTDYNALIDWNLLVKERIFLTKTSIDNTVDEDNDREYRAKVYVKLLATLQMQIDTRLGVLRRERGREINKNRDLLKIIKENYPSVYKECLQVYKNKYEL